MLVLSLVSLGLMLLAVTAAVRLMDKPDPVVIVLAVLANGFMCVALLWPVVIASLLSVVALAVWPPRPGSRRGYHLATLGAVGIGIGVPLLFALPEQVEFARLRTKYPFENLADRVPPRQPGIPPAFNTRELDKREADLDRETREQGWLTGRSRMLKRLHEDQVDLFVNSPGFGVTRAFGGRPSDRAIDKTRPTPQSSDPSLGLMVQEDVFDFADPANWGYRRGDRVAGFLPHALRRQPGPAQGWAVERVELVGLLLAPDPRVYVSASLPRMDELAHVETRHPDGFESQALAQLRSGEELVFDGPAGRLLGAVRAAKQCLDCHGGHRGELLGAFSYHLRAP